MWWENESLKAQLIETICQIIFWYFVLEIISKIGMNYVLKQSWCAHIAKQSGGVDEYMITLRAFPQHFISGLLIMIGIYSKNSNVFRSGVLGELAFEIIDMSRINNYLKSEQLKPLIIALLLHHVPGIICIIPANLCCSDDEYYQQIPNALLCNAWLFILLNGVCKIFNLENLFERTRFIVFYLISFLIFVYARLYWLTIAFYQFIIYRFHHYNWYVIGIFIIYSFMITGFNLCVVMLTIQRLKKLMYGNEPEQQEAAVLLRQTSTGIGKVRDVLNHVPKSTVVPALKRASTTPATFSPKNKAN